MRKIISILLSVYLFFAMGPYVYGATVSEETCTAAQVASSCPAGCSWSNTTKCKICSAGTYSTSSASAKCTTCPKSHPNGPVGATTQAECYKSCKGQQIDNGVFNDTATANYNNECAPKCVSANSCNFTCNVTVTDNKIDFCTSYQANSKSASCVPMWSACTPSNGQDQAGIKSPLSTCFATPESCKDGYTFIPGTTNLFLQYCSTHQLGECKSNTIACSSRLHIPTDANNQSLGGSIGGNATITDKGAYDFSQCTWTRTGIPVNNGTGTKTCKYTGTSSSAPSITTKEADWGNCETKASHCSSGYCLENENCITPRQGYYTGYLNCEPCPAGATSNAGAKSQSECFMQRGVTKFCDSTGQCFTLGGSGNIPHTPTTN